MLGKEDLENLTLRLWNHTIFRYDAKFSYD
jgi:hypothetical protein